MNGELFQYGVAGAVTFLLLREVFGFIVKMRERSTTSTITTQSIPCSFTAHQDVVVRNLTEIRDGIRELVLIQSKRK